MSHNRTDTQISDSQRLHSPDGVWSGTVALSSLGLLVLIILAMIGTSSVFHWLYPGPALKNAGAEWNSQNDIPGVSPNQAYQRGKIEAEEQTYLTEYAWQDKKRGMARIPIQRGIELMAERDLSVRWPEREAGAATKIKPAEAGR